MSKKISISIILLMLTGTLLTACESDNIPPEVVSTSPQNNAQDVDADLTEITVTFNEPMMDESWSWAQENEESFPEMTEDPYYTDNNTKAVLPVKLEKNKDYVIWINTENRTNFKDKAGNSVKPYKLEFKTAGGEPPKVISTSPKNGAKDVDPDTDEIWVEFDKTMMDESWSWAYENEDEFPEMTGDPSYTENYTKNTLPVKLEPDKEYVVWINTEKLKNFKDEDGTPAEPFEFKFKTAESSGDEETEDLETYENKELGFTLKMSTDTKVDKELNDENNRLVVFKSGKENFEVRVKEGKDTSLDKYFYLDFPVASKSTLGGEEAVVSEAPNGYCDGPGCGDPFVVYSAKKGDDFYSIVFYGDAELSDAEKSILSSFEFL
jgi:hypothetical protein